MKRVPILVVALMIFSLDACKEPVEPAAYCQFTFKGREYNIPDADFYSDFVIFGIHSGPVLFSDTRSPTQPRLVIRPNSESIFLALDSLDMHDRNYDSQGVYYQNQGTVSRNGARFDFSGKLGHQEYLQDTVIVSDWGQIQGHCVCKIK